MFSLGWTYQCFSEKGYGRHEGRQLRTQNKDLGILYPVTKFTGEALHALDATKSANIVSIVESAKSHVDHEEC